MRRTTQIIAIRGVNAAPTVSANTISLLGGVYTGSYTYTDADLDLENNEPPQALDLNISGTPEVTQVQTASFTFYSPNLYTAGTHTYQWYRADDTLGTNEAQIAGATSITYTTVAGDIGKVLSVDVTVVQTATGSANGNNSATFRSGYTPTIGNGFDLSDIPYHMVFTPAGMSDDGDLHWTNEGSIGGELLGTGASKPTLNAGQIDFAGSQYLDAAIVPSAGSDYDIMFKAKWDDFTIERVLYVLTTDTRNFFNTTGSLWRMQGTNTVTTVGSADTSEHIFRVSKQYPNVIIQVWNTTGSTPILDETLSGINTSGIGAGSMRVGAKLTGGNAFDGFIKYLCIMLDGNLSQSQVDGTVDYMQNN